MTKRASPRYVLTPVSKKTGKRLTFYVSRKDVNKVTRGPGVKGVVTDLDTKETYRIDSNSGPK